MSARKSLSALLVALFLALATPGPGWGGGQDVVLNKDSNGTASGGSPKHDSVAPRLRGSGRIGAASAPRLQEERQSWMTWVWNMLASLYGQFFRTSSDHTRY